jgi:hypothetical protein
VWLSPNGRPPELRATSSGFAGTDSPKDGTMSEKPILTVSRKFLLTLLVSALMVGVAAVVGFLVVALPDLKRYLRLRHM